MTQYHRTPPAPFPSRAVQERKAARKKVIEKARKLERDSFMAMMRFCYDLQASCDML
jgi:hypothetical protein